MPPAIRKLARLIPTQPSKGCPSSAKNIRIAQAMSEERIAIARRCAPGVPRVRLAKIGAQPGGSMITRKVTRAEPNSSIIFALGPNVVVEHFNVATAIPLIDPKMSCAALPDLPVPAERLVGGLSAPVVLG